MNLSNPLVPHIRRILEKARTESSTASLQEHARLGEYDIMERLQERGIKIPVDDSLSYNLTMFRKHFLVMNALYQLQAAYLQEGWFLSISALDIYLTPLQQADGHSQLSDEPGLAELQSYYLDWHNFDKTDDASVSALLENFWQRYFSFEQQDEALATLGLAQDADWSDVQEQYRRLASEHHPDRGGDGDQFRVIRQAYEAIAARYK